MKLLLLVLLATQAVNKVPPPPAGYGGKIVYDAPSNRIVYVPKPRVIRITSITRGALINNPYAPNGYGVEANTIASPHIHLSLACEVVAGMEVGETYFTKQSNNPDYPQFRLIVFTDPDGKSDNLMCIVSDEREIIRLERVK